MSHVKDSRRLLAFCLFLRCVRWVAIAVAAIVALWVLFLLVLDTRYPPATPEHKTLLALLVSTSIPLLCAWVLLWVERRLLEQYHQGR